MSKSVQSSALECPTLFRMAVLSVILSTVAACESTAPVTSVLRLDSVSVFAADSTLGSIRAMTMDEDGNLWALNNVSPFLTRYDPTGRITFRGLMAGEGPNEVTVPRALFSASHEETAVIIWDVRHRQLVSLDAEATVRERYSLGSISGPIRNDIDGISSRNPFRIHPTSEGYVVESHPSGLTTTADYRHGALLHVDSSFAHLNEILTFDGLAPDSSILGDRRDLLPIPHWAGCDARAVAVFNPYQLQVVWVTTSGSTLHVAELGSIEHERLSERDIEAYLYERVRLERGPGASDDPSTVPEIRQVVNRALRDKKDLFSDLRPPVRDLLCSQDRTVWLELFSAEAQESGRANEWVVVRSDGREARVALPRGFMALLVRPGRIYGVFSDSLDVQRVGVVYAPRSIT